MYLIRLYPYPLILNLNDIDTKRADPEREMKKKIMVQIKSNIYSLSPMWSNFNAIRNRRQHESK